MILKASQRGGGMQLAAHLMKPENEQVELHEVRGFIADDMKGAMKEAQAVAMGTRCKQHLFSVSLNPPERESVGVAAFERAIDRVEAANGLTGQPRIIIFHEKEGRRHAHAVWNRIDADTMTAKPLPFFKMKLREVSKALYLEHGWQMPRGLMGSQARDPRNFSLAEWQQAKRTGRDPAVHKVTMQECWAASDSGAAFGQALEERGLYLARGDRRAHVVVTYEGEVLSVARMIGKKAKEVTAKLGATGAAPSVADTEAHIANVITPHLKELIAEANRARTAALTPLHERRHAMKLHHRAERARLDEDQRVRKVAEATDRTARLRSGIAGLWDRLTGQRERTVRENNAETLASMRRDRAQRDDLVVGQLAERRELQRDILAVRHRHVRSVLELHRDLARQDRARETRAPEQDRQSNCFNREAGPVLSRPRNILRGQGRDASRDGPDMER